MTQSNALKTHLNRGTIQRLGKQIKTAYPGFPIGRFVNAAVDGLDALEFTARTQHIAAALHMTLPDDVPRALSIVTDSLPEPLPHADGMFSEHFWLWPLSDFIRHYGVMHWAESMEACYLLTQCFTAEYAIRPLLQRRPAATLNRLLAWTEDESQHVRRLCSEGTRPRLPWATRLKLDTKTVLPILHALRSDKSKFVQKSVANHLNDLSKDHPALVLKTLRQWNRTKNPATAWITRHALRTRIKAGDQAALAMLGYEPIKVNNVILTVTPKSIRFGDPIQAELRFHYKGRKKQPTIIDWVLYYHRPPNSSYRKVFKGKSLEISPNETVAHTKIFNLQVQRTRSLYAGEHRLEAQINGATVAATNFTLHTA